MNIKCAIPKGAGNIIKRAKSVAYASAPVVTLGLMAMSVIYFIDDFWIAGSGTGAFIMLSIHLSKVPFSVSGMEELKEKVYTGKGEPHCGNPNLPSDEQLIADGVYSAHRCLEVGSIWITMVGGYLLLTWLFANYLALPWLI